MDNKTEYKGEGWTKTVIKESFRNRSLGELLTKFKPDQHIRVIPEMPLPKMLKEIKEQAYDADVSGIEERYQKMGQVDTYFRALSLGQENKSFEIWKATIKDKTVINFKFPGHANSYGYDNTHDYMGLGFSGEIEYQD